MEDNDYDNDYDDIDFVEEDAQTYGGENFWSVDSPYLMPYIYMRPFLDTQ